MGNNKLKVGDNVIFEYGFDVRKGKIVNLRADGAFLIELTHDSAPWNKGDYLFAHPNQCCLCPTDNKVENDSNKPRGGLLSRLFNWCCKLPSPAGPSILFPPKN